MADLTLYGFRLTSYELSRERVRLVIEVVLLGPPIVVIDSFTVSAALSDGQPAILGEVKQTARRIAALHADQRPWLDAQIGVVRNL